MENETENLNTEANDIAGNRIDGPVGNTASRHDGPGTGVGIPGGPAAPQADNGGQTPADTNRPAAAASSESLVDSEMSAGAGAVDDDGDEQENREANPAALRPPSTPAAPAAAQGARYGGNFSNSTQGSYRDQERRDNQDSDPNRGEFGAQDLGGTTHGGFGNQNRQADYAPRDSAEDRYYGGAGRPGPQDNAYRAYDGQDERPDPRTQYGFERGTAPAVPAGRAAEAGSTGPGAPSGPGYDNTNRPDRADPLSAHQNDNGSPIGPDRGFAADYGHTSLPGGVAPAAAVPATDPAAGSPRRNQGEDAQSSRGGYDNQGTAGGREGHRHEEQHPGYDPNTAAVGARGTQPSNSQGDGDRGREQPQETPDYRTGNNRNGYAQPEAQANQGDTAQGVGSRGGSYNDAYDDSRSGSTTGHPAPGDQRREDLNANYGQAAREENRADDAENQADHGAPRRNAGREGEGDE